MREIKLENWSRNEELVFALITTGVKWRVVADLREILSVRPRLGLIETRDG